MTDNVIHFPTRGPVAITSLGCNTVPGGVSADEFHALLGLIEDAWHNWDSSHELASAIVAAGWRPVGTGGAA